MSGHERKGEPLWWAPPAGTNGPGRLDGRGSPQIANFMTYPATGSFRFSIGRANTPKCMKKPRQAHFQCKTSTGGTDLHKRHFDVDPMETARRAEADRRADYDRRVEIARADYDRRVEMARRDEYDRRMEYDLSAYCQIRKMSTAEDFELQVRRLDEMGKIIDTLTTMFTKPPQPQGSATEKITLLRSCLTTMITKSSRHEASAAEAIETTLVSSSSQQVLAIEDTAGGSYEDCEDWSLHMTDEEGKALSVLIRMQEPGEFSSQEVLARKVRRIPRPDMDPRREMKDTDEDEGFGFLRANHEQLTVRKIVKVNRMLHPNPNPNPNGFGFERASETELRERKILICSRGSVVERQDGLVFNDSTRITKGAEGKVMGMERKRLKTEKKIQRKRKGIERARQAWAQKLRDGIIQRQHKQVRTLARVLRTSDPKLRTQKIIFSIKDPGMNGHRLGDVMSLRSYKSTKREKMELITLVTKRASKKGQDKRDNAIRMIDKNEMKDWWKRLTTSKRNLKRQYRKGSTDVYLLKRTMELEID